MTLNGHFALKSVSGSVTNGLASPAFGQNCSKICRATHIVSATKFSPGNVVSGSTKFMQIFAGFPGEGCQMTVWSLKMAIFAFFVHCLPYILHTWPHNSFHVMQLSMTLVICDGRVCLVKTNIVIIICPATERRPWHTFFQCLLDLERVPKSYEPFSRSCATCCYQIFNSLKLCQFATDRNWTFRRHLWPFSPSSYRLEFLSWV